ncbi:hypothetical protein OQA88_9041 [Cercophora sp. LCS_1]
MGTPTDQIRSWTRTIGDTVYTCSADPSLIQLDALNAAFASDMIWWAKPLGGEELKTMARNSLCFGIYASDGRTTGEAKPMIAFARLITDYVTFGYLTDVYVLPPHQERGLGRWLMVCLNEMLDSWPSLRRCVLFTGDAHAVKLYEQTLGMSDVRNASSNLIIMQKMGRVGAPEKPSS